MDFYAYFDYFKWIWLCFVLFVFVFGGIRELRKFGEVDETKLIYSEKWASGRSSKSWWTRLGSAKNVLHIMISDKELIIKTNFFFAFIAKRYDLMHRIPLTNLVSVEPQRRGFVNGISVRFNNGYGEIRELILVSKNGTRLKELLDATIGKL